MHIPRILVCGSRYFEDYAFIDTELDKFIKETYHGKRVIIITGGAKGVDDLAELYARMNRLPQMIFHAEWEKKGKAAGPLRNQLMLDEGKPDFVIGFLAEGSKGTKDMLTRAVEQGFQTKCILLPKEPSI